MQRGQPAQAQLKEMHPVASAVPKAADDTGLDEGGRCKADFFSQLTPCRRFGGLNGSDTAARQIPLGAIGRPHQQQIRTDIDRDQRALMVRVRQPPPEPGKGKFKTERRPPGEIERRRRPPAEEQSLTLLYDALPGSPASGESGEHLTR